MPRHASGGRVTRSHSTIIDAASPVLKALEKIRGVGRISLGEIKTGLGTAPHRIKLITVNGGFLLQVRGSTSVQSITVYTSNPQYVEKALRTALAQRFHFSS